MKELKGFQQDKRTHVLNLGSLCSDCTRTPGLVTHHCRKAPGFSGKTCFLPNEPKVVQCLPMILKNKVLTKGTKTGAKPLKTQLKQHQTDTNEAKTTPFSP
jgi:hypothetical protein